MWKKIWLKLERTAEIEIRGLLREFWGFEFDFFAALCSAKGGLAHCSTATFSTHSEIHTTVYGTANWYYYRKCTIPAKSVRKQPVCCSYKDEDDDKMWERHKASAQLYSSSAADGSSKHVLIYGTQG